MNDLIAKKALEIVEVSGEVLETKEILEEIQISLNRVTRTKLFSRLNNLRGEGLIKGKFIGPGKGVWIWWKKDAFSNNILDDKTEVKNEK
ncbi:MAG: hypothetical protein ABH840_03130 [Nanoarchaeota archaeon]